MEVHYTHAHAHTPPNQTEMELVKQFEVEEIRFNRQFQSSHTCGISDVDPA